VPSPCSPVPTPLASSPPAPHPWNAMKPSARGPANGAERRAREASNSCERERRVASGATHARRWVITRTSMGEGERVQHRWNRGDPPARRWVITRCGDRSAKGKQVHVTGLYSRTTFYLQTRWGAKTTFISYMEGVFVIIDFLNFANISFHCRSNFMSWQWNCSVWCSYLMLLST
jgi:hypothetical protein